MSEENTKDEKDENKKTIVKGPTCDDCDHWHNKPECKYNEIHEFIKKCARGNIVSKNTQICDFVKLRASGTEKVFSTPGSSENKSEVVKKIDFKNKTPKNKKE